MQVQEDIRTTLKLQDPVKLISSFDRPNIHFAVRALHEDSNTIQLIADDLEEQKTENEYPCAIIYARKKEMVDTIARTLSSDGELEMFCFYPPFLLPLNYCLTNFKLYQENTMMTSK